MKKQEPIEEKQVIPKTNILTIVLLAMMSIALAFTYTKAKNLESQVRQIVTPSPSPIVIIIPSPTPQPTPTPNSTNIPKTTTNTSQITCIGPDEKQFKTTMTECKAVNDKWNHPLDYMITCKIHPDCGGGTKFIAKSECDKPCYGSNTQTNTATQVVTNNKTAVYLGGFTYYCEPSAENAIKDAYNEYLRQLELNKEKGKTNCAYITYDPNNPNEYTNCYNQYLNYSSLYQQIYFDLVKKHCP